MFGVRSVKFASCGVRAGFEFVVEGRNSLRWDCGALVALIPRMGFCSRRLLSWMSIGTRSLRLRCSRLGSACLVVSGV